MFTREQLHERIHELLKRPHVIPIQVTTFEAERFETPSSEQQIVIHRAPTGVADAVQFWVSSVAQLDWWRKRGGEGYRSHFLKDSLCRPLTEPEFNALVRQHSAGLRQPLRLPLHEGGTFAGAHADGGGVEPRGRNGGMGRPAHRVLLEHQRIETAPLRFERRFPDPESGVLPVTPRGKTFPLQQKP